MAAPIPDAVEYLWEKLHEMEPSTELGGIFASKPGYHNTRDGNAPGNYSIVDPQDQGGPGNLAAALDWTFPDAQAGRYDLIIKYSKMREFYGQADKDTQVEGWDFRYAVPASSDSSHLWHIHFSFSRNALTTANMDKLLDVLGYNMPLSDDDILRVAKKVWTLDGVKEAPDAPKPPHEDPDYGDPANPADGNKNWAAKSYLRRTYESTDQGLVNDEALAAQVTAIATQLAEVLAILQAGTPVPGAVNLTPDSISNVATATANELQTRLAE